MKNLQKNSKIACAIVIGLFLGMLCLIGYLSSSHHALQQSNESLSGKILDTEQSNTPKELALTKRKNSLQGKTNTVVYIDDLATITQSLTSDTSNNLQKQVLELAGSKSLAIRNYIPGNGNYIVGNKVYNGNLISFSVHGDYKPILQFLASLENSIPLVRVKSVQMIAEVAPGGKIKASVEIFIPNLKK